MKAAVIILVFALGSIECRKIAPEINKNANVDFINMESGARDRFAPTIGPQGFPPGPPQRSAPSAPIAPTIGPPGFPPGPPQPKIPTSPVKPVVTAKPVPVVPVTQPPKPIQPQQPNPNQGFPSQLDLKPVMPSKSGSSGITTPGPGNVKQLVTFYDSQGKASNIRPYNYSDAVKHG